MIIVCPQCAKEYRVDPAELPPAKSSQHHRAGKGWWLSCRFCFKEWWYTAPKGFAWYDGGVPPEQYAKTVVRKPARFEDKTDLSQLERRAPSQGEEELMHHEMLMHQQYTPYEVAPEEIIELQTPRRHFSIKSLLAALGVIGLSVTGYFLKPLWLEDTAGYVNKTVNLDVPDEQKLILGLHINNVRYDVENKTDKRIIKVMGCILNTNDKEAKLPPLKINIWGPCKPDSLGDSLQLPDQPTPQCLIKAWEHSLKEEKLKSSGNIEFEASSQIMLDTAIQKVEVTFLG